MAGRTPYEAWVNYQVPLREALRCIASGRFVLREPPAGLSLLTEYSVTLNDMDSVPLRGASRIFLIAGQTVRIGERADARRQVRYRVEPRSYVYSFTIGRDLGERELLTFHWNGRSDFDSAIPRGHLYIG